MSSQPSLPPEVPAGLALYRAQVDANAVARQSIADQVMVQVRALVEAFTQWYDDLAVRRLAKDITGVVQAGQKVMAAHEDAYMASVLSAQAGRTVRPVGQVAVDDLRRGVDPVQVYERLGEQFRYTRSTGKDWSEATKAVLDRAAVVTETDITLAARAQDQKSLQATDLAIGYRRVIHPELAKGGTCGMCIAASDRVYHKRYLLPIHYRCACTVSPIMRGGEDPGNSLNNLSLGDLYDHAGGTQAVDLKRTRYKVEDHTELGPQLVPAHNPASKYLARTSDAGIAEKIKALGDQPASKFRTDQLARLTREQEIRARAAKRAARQRH